MDSEALIRHCLQHIQQPKYWEGKLLSMDGQPAGQSTIYAVIEGKRPFGLRWIIDIVNDTGDCVIADELASLAGCFLVKKIKRPVPARERIVAAMAKLETKLKNSGKIATKECNQLARDLLGYGELLSNGKG